MTLKQMAVGQRARISALDPNHPSAVRLAEMGLLPGEEIHFLGRAPFGEPYRVEIMDYELCLRESDALAISIEVLQRAEDQ